MINVECEMRNWGAGEPPLKTFFINTFQEGFFQFLWFIKEVLFWLAESFLNAFDIQQLHWAYEVSNLKQAIILLLCLAELDVGKIHRENSIQYGTEFRLSIIIVNYNLIKCTKLCLMPGQKYLHLSGKLTRQCYFVRRLLTRYADCRMANITGII